MWNCSISKICKTQNSKNFEFSKLFIIYVFWVFVELKKIVKRKNKFENIEKSNNSTHYFYIRNFEIPKYRPFYIWSLQMLTPTRLRSLEWLGIYATKIFKNLVDKNKYDKTTLIPTRHLQSFYRF